MGGDTENKLIVRRYLEEVNNEGNLALADELIAPQYRWHPDGPIGRDRLKEFVAWQRATAPDWRIVIRDMIAEGDKVVVRATASGTQTEQAPGLAHPAPRYRELSWIAIYRLEGGQIVEAWVESRQLHPPTAAL